jgi:predicted nuclease with TOPRIM domain
MQIPDFSKLKTKKENFKGKEQPKEKREMLKARLQLKTKYKLQLERTEKLRLKYCRSDLNKLLKL